ncbi:transcriptional regulator TraR [Agrobacterium sp. P15N1-A]|uniref:autoinducer-binding transcriptional regulator TraR n=1 Tax=Agrobacterium sp. P15N1-A TaxID=3342820 RepID=UPI0037D00B64
MKHWLERLTDVTAIRLDEKGLNEVLGTLSAELGFGLFAFYHAGVRSYVYSNYDPVWQQTYFDDDLKAIDPVLSKAKKLWRAFSWSWEDDRGSLTKAQADMFAASSDFGIRSGVTIPIRAPNGSMSMLTVASDAAKVRIGLDIDAIAAAAAVGQLHARIEFMSAQPTMEDPETFTPKEARFLRWIEAGKTAPEIAEIEGVKYNTVRINLENAKKRFKASNITQLAALAIRRRLI